MSNEYRDRDLLLGKIAADTARNTEVSIQTQKDVKELHGRMSAMEVKAGMWGVFGGMAIFAAAKLKSLFWIE